MLLTEVSKCWKKVATPKIKVTMKNCETLYESQRVSRLEEIIQPLHPPPPPIQIKSSLEQKFSYVDIQKYTGICFQSASRMQFLGVNK